MEKTNRFALLSRDTIKYIAISAMTLNHFAQTFMKEGTVVRELFVGIGYFTIITMSYFLVEGVKHTHSRHMYGMRLLCFGIISEIPYCLTISKGTQWILPSMNVILTLFICFLILVIQEEIPDTGMRLGITLGLIFVSSYGDWGVIAPVMTLLFYRAGERREERIRAYIYSIALIVINEAASIIHMYEPRKALIYVMLHAVGPIASALIVIGMYNGEKGRMYYSKWVFYVYYPLHLLAIGLVAKYGLLR